MSIAVLNNRADVVRRGRRLEYFTIAWNCLEGLIAIGSGLVAGSVALVGFGLDSFIEVSSGAALLWRLGHDWNAVKREHAERITLRIVGWCFLALGTYIAADSLHVLVAREAPEKSPAGIALAIVSLIAMPLLARAKRRVAASLTSSAMAADAKQTEFCAYLSAILLAGLLFNALLGWWWADPVAGLALVFFIAREGLEVFRSQELLCID